MPTLIDAIYEGILCPVDHIDPPDTPETRQAERCSQEAYCTLAEQLTDEQAQLLEALLDCRSGYEALVHRQAFAEGFRLGCRLIGEVCRQEPAPAAR